MGLDFHISQWSLCCTAPELQKDMVDIWISDSEMSVGESIDAQFVQNDNI